MDERADTEELIRRVTEAVMLRLGAGESCGGNRRVVLLLPVPSARLDQLARWCEELRAGSTDTTVVAADPVVEEMERRGLRGRFGPQVCNARACNLGELAGGLGAGELVVVGSLGYRFARDLVALHDDDPVVWLASRALLAGTRVAMVTDDLAPPAPAGGAADTTAGRQAGSLLRELEVMGLHPVPMAELAARAEQWSRAAATLVRSLGGLVSEADVGRLAAEGDKRVRLPAGTVVTPLAASRAAELGLELVREDE